MPAIQLRKAERKQAKLRIGLFGPSGSGKTTAALKIARGITEWDKICIIDTENGSADLYSKMGDFNVISLTAPFNPEKYIEAIDAALAAGMEVIIVDSITHEWAGKGGILELSDDLDTGGGKNSFTVWKKLTPRHNAFIDSITGCPVDIICCGRSKQEYVMNQKEKNGKVINVPEKVGLKAITREGFDYEMTLSFEISINHYASTSKDRTGLFMDKPEFVLSEEVGHIIKEWNASVAPDITAQKQEIMRQLTRLALPHANGEQCKTSVLLNTELELTEPNYTGIISKLRLIKTGQAKQPPIAPPAGPETPPQQPPAATPPAQPGPEHASQEQVNDDASAPSNPHVAAAPAAGQPPVKPAAKPAGLSDLAVSLKRGIEVAFDNELLNVAWAEVEKNHKILTPFEMGSLKGARTAKAGELQKEAEAVLNKAREMQQTPTE